VRIRKKIRPPQIKRRKIILFKEENEKEEVGEKEEKMWKRK
jgi:hypothetical protein